MANPWSEASVAMMSATVQQRKDRGTWRVVVHRAGKRRVFECKTEGEARAKAAALNARQDASDGWLADGHSSPELTLRVYAHLMDQGAGEMGWLDENFSKALPDVPHARDSVA